MSESTQAAAIRVGDLLLKVLRRDRDHGAANLVLCCRGGSPAAWAIVRLWARRAGYELPEENPVVKLKREYAQFVEMHNNTIMSAQESLAAEWAEAEANVNDRNNFGWAMIVAEAVRLIREREKEAKRELLEAQAAEGFCKRVAKAVRSNYESEVRRVVDEIAAAYPAAEGKAKP